MVKKKNTKGLEYISCNICGSNKYKLYTKNSGFNLVKCSGCGLIYANPQPTIEYLVNFYSSGHHTEENWGKKTRYSTVVNKGHRKIMEFLSSIYKNKKIKILDVGSGLNQPDYIKKRRWSFIGTELSKTYVSYAKSKGWNVVFGDMIDMNFKNKEFDVVTIMAVVEHLKNPAEYLLESRRILKDDGTLIIKVPNLNYTLKHATTLPMSEVMHLYYFTPKTINMLITKCGYDVIKIDSVLECGSEDLFKNIIMQSWNVVSRMIYRLTGIHTNLQMVIYAKKTKQDHGKIQNIKSKHKNE